MQPAGRYLGEKFHRAGGVPAVMKELLDAGKLHRRRDDRHRQDAGENLAGCAGAATAR
jgi:dihydroxyacid dehydratase/phosphogluconate dehydratase